MEYGLLTKALPKFSASVKLSSQKAGEANILKIPPKVPIKVSVNVVVAKTPILTKELPAFAKLDCLSALISSKLLPDCASAHVIFSSYFD